MIVIKWFFKEVNLQELHISLWRPTLFLTLWFFTLERKCWQIFIWISEESYRTTCPLCSIFCNQISYNHTLTVTSYIYAPVIPITINSSYIRFAKYEISRGHYIFFWIGIFLWWGENSVCVKRNMILTLTRSPWKLLLYGNLIGIKILKWNNACNYKFSHSYIFSEILTS
jgi:hypothetical protein